MTSLPQEVTDHIDTQLYYFLYYIATFLQWNCRGYFTNYKDLKELIVAHKLKAFCLHKLQPRSRVLFEQFRHRDTLNRASNYRRRAIILLNE